MSLRAIYELLEQRTDACKHAAAEVQRSRAFRGSCAMTTRLMWRCADRGRVDGT